MSYEHPLLDTTDDVPFDALDDVLDRRMRQLADWGGYQDHDPQRWLAMLMERVGAWSQAILDDDGDGLYAEAAELAAIGFAIVQCARRNGWFLDGCEGVTHG